MTLLKIENLYFSYDKEILKNINFTIGKGEFVSLLGVNGAGKSTLIKLISRFLRPSGGEIYLNKRSLDDYSSKEMAKQIAYVSQYNTASDNTVFDNVLMGRLPYIKGNPKLDDYKIVNNLLEKFRLEKYKLRYSSTLSGGEHQMVVLARALAQEPKLLLLDEPSSNLDISNQINVMTQIRNYCKGKDISVLVSIHDINLALQFSDKFILLKEGYVYDYGGEEVINSKSIKDVYNIQVDILQHRGRKYMFAL